MMITLLSGTYTFADLDWQSILGGFGLFLFGIKFMGDGLKAYAGDKLRRPYVVIFVSSCASCRKRAREIANILGKFGIKQLPFFVFAIGRSFEVLGRGANYTSRVSGGDFNRASLQETEENLSVLFLIERRLSKKSGNLLKTLFLRLFGKKSVAVLRLRFTGKCLQQVFFCFGSFYTFFHKIKILIKDRQKNKLCLIINNLN